MRFILASDGVWDVLSEEAVVSIAVRVTNSLRAAKAIAQDAFHIRATGSMRLDDITVVVVDVNPDHRRSASAAITCGSWRCVVS